ncbi:MAG: glycosyltransferase family 1 protein [Pseudomonadota bacterium]
MSNQASSEAFPARALVVSDAWHPQINGVVRTLEGMVREAPKFGVDLQVLGPGRFRTIPMPSYPEIRLAVAQPRSIRRAIREYQPQAIHIATEGPLGTVARRFCLRHNLGFTTSYHTRFPEYLAARLPVPKRLSYAYMRRFHNAATACMVATPSLEADLQARGFNNLVRWSRGVDLKRYYPRADVELPYEKPIFTYVGRVAVEKNLEAFLDLDLPGTKLVVGGGPALDGLTARYQDAVFVGPKVGEELAEFYAGSDVFVFPSLTDTFGIVLLEAAASGLPVAAFPVTGPKDVITDDRVGVLSSDLKEACLAALNLDPQDCVQFAQDHSWESTAVAFFRYLYPLKADWTVPTYDY